MTTTQELLAAVLIQVNELIAWASADYEYSQEADAPEQAESDLVRVNELLRARDALAAAAHQGRQQL
jgi:hypothetical protein